MIWIVVGRPAVVIHRRMERLAGVTDEMTHYPHNVNDVLPGIGNFIRCSTRFFQGRQRRKAGL